MVPEGSSSREDEKAGSIPVMHLVFSVRCRKYEKLLAAYEQISSMESVVKVEAVNFVFQKQVA
ncbi:hypothetical protein D3C85_1905720 [compost metagenome]